MTAASDQPELQSFSAGLRRDQDALAQPWSSGTVESHIDRIKMLKRRMYRPRQPDLLRRRLVLAN